MDLYVGTSGYAYKEWKAGFYPEDLPLKRLLSYYGTQFRTVEINNTFYRMPKTSVLESWAADVPPDFRFVLKASRSITHLRRLKDSDEALGYLLQVSAALGERLGPLLFQLPPNLKKDAARLQAFLELLPRERRAAFEFRHQTWFDDEVFDILHGHGAALCLAEAEGDLKVPFVATADWGYVRLRCPGYDDAQLEARLERMLAQGWRDAFVFFKHEEDSVTSPLMALRFLELAETRATAA